MVGFYYNEYDFLPNKKYLIYFRGNFGMPTRGHFELVEKYIDLPNVKYLISQIGSERRHGIPYEFNRKIWKIYINALLPKEKIYLKKLESSLDVLNFIEDVDIVVFLRGREDDSIREKERLKIYAELIKKLKRHQIELDFLLIDRPNVDTLSSSKFVEALNKNKSYKYLKQFLPPISYEKAMYIINKLKSFPLH